MAPFRRFRDGGKLVTITIFHHSCTTGALQLHPPYPIPGHPPISILVPMLPFRAHSPLPPIPFPL